MNKVIRKTTGIVLGMTLALVSGAPAIADDTELLLVAPADASQFNPNVMFILDLSLIHISEPTRPVGISRMPSSA